MKIKQQFEIASPIEDVWVAFKNPEQLVNCLPGASIDSAKSSPDELALIFRVKLGPISASFRGTGSIEFNETDYSGTFSGSAVDQKSNSRVKGSSLFTLANAGPAQTSVTLDVDFAISGSLAQFSRENLVHSLADQLTQQFAHNLQAILSQSELRPESASAAQATDSSATAASQSAKPAPSLSLLGLIWGAIKQWLRNLGKGSSR